MDAVICTDFNESEVRSVPRPTPGEAEVLVSVERVQLSVTECNLYRGADIIHIEETRDRLAAGDGRLFGHEFSGEIVETGAAVDRFEPGDRVYAPGKISCGECPYCRVGHNYLCANGKSIGYDRPGALAEYFTVPPEPLSRLPDDVTPAEGAAMQPMHNSMTAVIDAGIRTGEVVAVIGTGVMGYQCAQFALLAGAGEVLAIDVVPEKLDNARRKGMTPVDAREADPVEVVLEVTDEIGADVVFEAVGGGHDHGTRGGDPLAQAFQMVRPGGRIVQIGHIAGDVPVTPRAMRSGSVDWINPTTWPYELGPNADTGTVVAEMVCDGRVSIDEYVTHELDGLGAFERALEITIDKPAYGALGPAQIVVSE